MELSLEAQVRREVARYALDEGRLRVLVEEQGASFSATGTAGRMYLASQLQQLLASPVQQPDR